MSIIKLDKVSKKYGTHIIFKDFSMEIDEGEFITIMGSSGRGKSTLLNIIGLLETPESGDLFVCGHKNPRFKSKDGKMLLRKDISYLFQNYGLLDNETVLYNLMISCKFLETSKKEKMEKIKNTLSEVGMDGAENKKVYQLSGGEQQRVALAKILLKESRIVLADEPTGNLDPHNRNLVLSLLQKLNKQGKTIIVVTHDPVVATFTQRTVEI